MPHRDGNPSKTSGATPGARIPAGPRDSQPTLGVIRIVVVVHGRAAVDGPAPMAVETTAGLARLGDPVEILRAESAEEIAWIAADPSIDLVLLDRLEVPDVALLLDAIPSDGPPSVVVCGDSEDEALEAFRAGASDCVHFGPDHERVLPVVLLEQVRRWRNDRQRRVSEQRIRWLEDLYAAIVAEMPAALVVIDPDGLIVAVNPEFERLFPPLSGSPGPATEFLAARLPSPLLDAIERHSLSDALSDGLADALPNAVPRRPDDGSEPNPAELVRVDGSEGEARAYEVRRRPLDQRGRTLILISDVTESDWLSERLEALRRDNRDIIRNINSALLVVDLAGRITFANPAAEKILGGRGGDLGGREVGDWFAASDSMPNPIEACLTDGTRSRGAETMLQRGDGNWIPVGISCSPRLDAEGRSRGAVAVFQDLSEIKQLELQVRQTEKMASIGQLAAGVAHEVNNPMGFIHANLNQMSEYLGDLTRYFEATARLQQVAVEGDMEAIRAAAEDVAAVSREVDLEFVRADFEKALLESNEGAERIRHIVKDLRDFSRMDLPARSSADVNQAIDSTVNIVRTMMKHAIHLEKNYRVLPEIEAYPMQLKQVFMNLLVNAYQAIEARENREPGVIRIETDHVGDEIVVRISDTGIGIRAPDLERIFEPFFTTKPVGAGTGLGLSTSFSIIERHGGRILVESEPDRGTTFEVWLPVSYRGNDSGNDSGKESAAEGAGEGVRESEPNGGV